jgi:hypothetical protein
MTVQVDQQPVDVNFTVTNTSPVPGSCTYDATKLAGLGQQNVSQSFNLDPGGSTTLTFPEPFIGAKYHVKITCTNADAIFGHFDTDVSGVGG